MSSIIKLLPYLPHASRFTPFGRTGRRGRITPPPGIHFWSGQQSGGRAPSRRMWAHGTRWRGRSRTWTSTATGSSPPRNSARASCRGPGEGGGGGGWERFGAAHTPQPRIIRECVPRKFPVVSIPPCLNPPLARALGAFMAHLISLARSISLSFVCKHRGARVVRPLERGVCARSRYPSSCLRLGTGTVLFFKAIPNSNSPNLSFYPRPYERELPLGDLVWDSRHCQPHPNLIVKWGSQPRWVLASPCPSGRR